MDDLRKITCKFSCDLCGLEDVEAEVPVRPLALDVVTWIKGVLGWALVEAHNTLKTFSRVMIPVADEEGNEAPHIGAAVPRTEKP